VFLIDLDKLNLHGTEDFYLWAEIAWLDQIVVGSNLPDQLPITSVTEL